jgi:hypothetical protein
LEPGTLTGWEYGSWFITAPAVVAALSILGYAVSQRRAFLVLALAAAAVVTLLELLGLSFLPDECGGGFLAPCPPGRDVLREAAWGLYFTLGASVSLTLASAAALRLAWLQTDR